MSIRRVICPGCQTKLQVPAGVGQGKIKCPKCGKVLAIRDPQAAATSAAPPPRPMPTVDFSEVARYTPPARYQPGAPVYRRTTPAGFGYAPHAPGASPQHAEGWNASAPPSVRPHRSSGSGGGTALKVLAIIGGLGFFSVLMCAGVFGTIGYLATRSSGWQSAELRGYTIDMPGGKEPETRAQPSAVMVAHEMRARRRETGSQYSLVVGDLGGAVADMTVDDFVGNGRIMLVNRQSIERNGVRGVSGKIISGVGAGSEAEIFVHNRHLVMSLYSPYSVIKDEVGGRMKPKAKEREMDEPEKFFASLRFP